MIFARISADREHLSLFEDALESSVSKSLISSRSVGFSCFNAIVAWDNCVGGEADSWVRSPANEMSPWMGNETSLATEVV